MSDSMDLERLGVFQVFTGDGTGSGFLIDKKTLLTNCHVVAPYRTVAVEMRDKSRIVGTVRRIHPKRDLAIVSLGQELPFDVLSIAPSTNLKAKQGINIIGFPVGLPLSITEGVISHPNQLLDDQHFVQTDAAINHGNSGGPIVDQNKNVIAVTTCKLSQADMVGFGIPSSDVLTFIANYAQQTEEFAVTCPACEALLSTPERYCNSCGSDLEEYDLPSYFEEPKHHPVVMFVETALRHANIDPVLARHGAHNWSFYRGSAPIKVWSCCSEHLCFSSNLAQAGKQNLGDLFRFLLSAEHSPFGFDLDDNIVRFNLTVHMSDVFAHHDHRELSDWIRTFLDNADKYDNLLIEKYGCTPAPDTQLTFLKEAE